MLTTKCIKSLQPDEKCHPNTSQWRNFCSSSRKLIKRNEIGTFIVLSICLKMLNKERSGERIEWNLFQGLKLINAFFTFPSAVCELHNFQGIFLMLPFSVCNETGNQFLCPVTHTFAPPFVIHAFNGFYLINFQEQSTSLERNSFRHVEVYEALKCLIKALKSIIRFPPTSILMNTRFLQLKNFIDGYSFAFRHSTLS